jgi:hypothetical protein
MRPSRFHSACCAFGLLVAPAFGQYQHAIPRAQTLRVRELDPSLPDVPIGDWVRTILGEDATVRWNLNHCPWPDPNIFPQRLCAFLRGADDDGRAIGVVLFVGTVDRGPVYSWTTPRLEESFVERGRESADAVHLPELPKLIKLPPNDWPKADLAIDRDSVRCTPWPPKALAKTTCAVSVANTGETAGWARVTLGVLQPGNDLGFGREGFVTVLPNTVETVRWELDWPPGAGWFVQADVELLLRSYVPYRASVKDRNVTNNRVRFEIGEIPKTRFVVPGTPGF